MTEHRINFTLTEIAKTFLDGDHSIFSPSGSKMWAMCSGSLIPNLLADDEPSFEAVEGTVAHSIGETWLKTGERPDERIGEVVRVVEKGHTFDIEITKSMLDYVQEYVDACMYLPGDKHVEKRVFFSKLTPLPRQSGTADHFACEPGVLTISDLKYGQGVAVYAAVNTDDPRSIIETLDGVELNGNSQGMLYALGVYFEWNWLYSFKKIIIRIYQPRRDNISVWETTPAELLRFAEWITERAKLAWALDAPRRAGEDICRFCRVKSTCPVYLKMFADIASDCFDDLDDEVSVEQMRDVIDDFDLGLNNTTLTEPVALTTDQLSKLLPFRSTFESWFAAVEMELERRAADGEKVAGHKLVESRSNRVFRSEAEAVQHMSTAGIPWVNLYSLKFVSPAQAEDLLRAHGMKRGDAVKFIEPVAFKPAGKPTLVPESDRRPEYVNPADEVFDDLDDL